MKKTVVIVNLYSIVVKRCRDIECLLFYDLDIEYAGKYIHYMDYHHAYDDYNNYDDYNKYDDYDDYTYNGNLYTGTNTDANSQANDASNTASTDDTDNYYYYV